MEFDIDSFNRLSLGIIEKEKCNPAEALDRLRSFTLGITCGEEIYSSIPLQAALLTAVNSAKRAFLGGVRITMPERVPCLLPWPGGKYLNQIVAELGGMHGEAAWPNNFSLYVGWVENTDENGLQLICNDWQAGVIPAGCGLPFEPTGTVPTAGVFAGSLGVALAFLKISGVQLAAADKPVGLSLWRPDLQWLDDAATGPAITFLPKKYWLLGLGHLGQAYLWNIGLLPYGNPADVTVLLQDYDHIVAANWSAGLLSEMADVGYRKTRLCSKWLEGRGFETFISERRFDEFTKRILEEPFVALCGFDSAKSRLPLEQAGFDFIVEAGLGSNIATFDKIALHTFPEASKSPFDLWGGMDEARTEVNQVVYEILKEMDKETCGIVPLTIAGKTVSASFVGAAAGALALAELSRGLHGGMRYDKINIQLRDLMGITAVPHQKGVYLLEQARNGFLPVAGSLND